MAYRFSVVSFPDDGTMFHSLLCPYPDVIQASVATLHLESDEQLAVHLGFTAGYSSIDSGEERGNWP
jgi:hypothetical protein